MTEVNMNGELVPQARTTKWSNYPLPPLIPGRFRPQYNSYRQYLLPHPETGRETTFSRATTIAGVLDDTYKLEKWIQRKLVKAVLDGVRLQMKMANPDAAAIAEYDYNEQRLTAAMNQLWGMDPSTQQFNGAIDMVDNVSGGQDAKEFGEAVHAWLEALDAGIVRPADIPEMFRGHTEAYRELLVRHGLFPVPQYTERIVFNDDNGITLPGTNGFPPQVLCGSESITGCLDRLFRVITTGTLRLGDIKTSKAESLVWAILEFCAQLAVYRWARLMLSLDGKAWEPMPELDGSTAYLMHIPSDDYKRAACIAISTEFGAEVMRVSIYARDLRRRAKREGLVGVIPIPSPEALQWAAARHAIQNISGPGDLPAIWEQYKGIWTEELTTLGRQIADLVNRTTPQGAHA